MEMSAQDIRFVVGPEGQPTAVLVDIAIWERILDALEDAEDVALAREALAILDTADGNLEKAGFISWASVREELENIVSN